MHQRSKAENHRSLGESTLIALAILAAPAAYSQQTDALPQTAESAATLQEVVVTATRREETVQSVPFQVTAMTASDLSRIDAHNLGDFSAYVPGLITNSGAGPGLVVIRGVTTGTEQLNSAIGLYLDDVPLGASSPFGLGYQSFNVNTFDLNRVEILNGPQGTLYGANSLGGSLKYVTAAPDPHDLDGVVETEGSGTQHGGANYGLRGMVNLPIGDGFGALRIDGLDEYDSGFIADPVHDRTNQGAIRNEGGRVSLLLNPASNVDARLSAYYQRDASMGVDAAFRNFETHQPTLGTYAQDYPLIQPAVSTLTLYSAVVNWNLPGVKVSSISGYQIDHGFSETDQTLVYDAVLAPLLVPFGEAADPWQLYVNATTRKLTQEVRLVSTSSSWFQWILGGYFDNEHTDEVVDLFDEANPAGTLLGVPPFDDTLPSHYRELAGYADATISLTKAFSIGLGVRYSSQHQTYRETVFGLLATGSDAVYASPLATTDGSVTTYSINPKYQLTPQTMVYARAASGFRPGGPNFRLAPGLGNQSFQPDKLWNYELGEKSALLGGRGMLDFDIYDIEWKNIQVVVNNGGVNQLENADSARVEGAELAFKYRLVQQLTVGGSAAYTDARLTAPAPVLGVESSGARLPLSPRFNFALLGTYAFDLAPEYTGALTLTDRWLGERNEGFGTTASPLYRLGSFNTVDLDFAWSMPHGLSVDIYAKNVFDTVGEIDSVNYGNEYDPSAPTPVELSQPRTIGVVLRASL